MRPAIFPPTVVKMMKFLMKKSLKCIWVMEGMYIGVLRPATLILVIMEVIIVVMSVEVDLGHKSPSTIHLSIVEQELMLKVEVYIGLIPATLPPKTQVAVIYF